MEFQRERREEIGGSFLCIYEISSDIYASAIPYDNVQKLRWYEKIYTEIVLKALKLSLAVVIIIPGI